MERKEIRHWPVPPDRIAKKWPNGFPEDGSDAFNELAYKYGRYVFGNVSSYLGRELSTIDRYEIVRHARDVMRQYFGGDYNLPVFEEIEQRYFDGLAGYMTEQADRMVDGTMEERSQKVRHLFHKLHAKAHHE